MRRRSAPVYAAVAAVCVLLAAPGSGAADEPPAKALFGAKAEAAGEPARAIGFYSRGCLAGAVEMPADGPAWQVMRLSRNRNWGHPRLVALIKRLARESKQQDGWPGLLVGDLAQPRGGPMLSGHRSHQVGLDADIWLMPMPERRLSREEREEMSAVSMIEDPFTIDRENWRPGHVTLLKRAASYGEVERIFVHPAIKKALCEATGEAGWLRKIRPWWGHHYHFHIRIKCPPGSGNCRSQEPPPPGPGCGESLDYWFDLFRQPPEPEPEEPEEPDEIMMAELPQACRGVLAAGEAETIPAPQRRPQTPRPARASRPAAELPWLRGAAAPPPDRKPKREDIQ